MAEFPWGSLIGAAGNLIGGLLGQSNASDARAAAAAEAAANREFQVNAYKHGIRWRVEDAKAAGIHPLAAIGAPAFNPSPVSVSGSVDQSMPTAIANMGQDIGRAVNATRTQDERTLAFTEAARAQQLEGLRLDNELKRIQFQSGMQRLRQMENPPMPGASYRIPGQPATGTVNTTLLLSDPGMNTSTSSVGQAVPDVAYIKGTKGMHAVPSAPAKELIEDNLFHEGMHFLRNNVLPIFGINMQPPGPAPKGKHWKYDPVYGYRLYDGERDSRPWYRGLSKWEGVRKPGNSSVFNPYMPDW